MNIVDSLQAMACLMNEAGSSRDTKNHRAILRCISKGGVKAATLPKPMAVACAVQIATKPPVVFFWLPPPLHPSRIRHTSFVYISAHEDKGACKGEHTLAVSVLQL